MNTQNSQGQMKPETLIREKFEKYDVAGYKMLDPVNVELTIYKKKTDAEVDRIALWEDKIMLSSEGAIFSIDDITAETARDVALRVQDELDEVFENESDGDFEDCKH